MGPGRWHRKKYENLQKNRSESKGDHQKPSDSIQYKNYTPTDSGGQKTGKNGQTGFYEKKSRETDEVSQDFGAPVGTRIPGPLIKRRSLGMIFGQMKEDILRFYVKKRLARFVLGSHGFAMVMKK